MTMKSKVDLKNGHAGNHDIIIEADKNDLNGVVKVETEENEDPDIDRGYAWVILVASTCLFCTFASTFKSFGVFFNAFVEEFGSQSSLIAIIPGILQGTYSVLTLPILTFGLHHFSTRQLCIVAGLFGSCAFIAGSFANSVQILILTNGIMIGCSFAFLHGPFTYLNGVYFVKRRNLAQAITVAGSSFGGLIFPPIITFLIDQYGLRGAMLICAGVQLHIIVFAMLMRPKRTKQNESSKSRSSSLEKIENTSSNAKPSDKLLKYQTQNGEIKTIVLPLLQIERERSTSESLGTKQREKHVEISKPFMSVQNLDVNEFRGSKSSFLDKISSSNITKLLGENEISRMSLNELRIDHYASTETVNSEKSTRCLEEINIIDFSLLKHWFIWVYLVVYCIGSIGCAFTIVFVAPFAKDQGFSTEQIAILVSTMNGCDFIGRLLNGIITDRNIVKNHHAIIITVAITTLILLLAPFYTKFWHFVLLGVVAGLCTGGIYALTPTVIVDFLGIENFRSGMGILVLGQGVAMGCASPFIGYLRDLTGTYIASFFFMGGCTLVAVLTFIVGLLINQKSLK